ncbi:MAG: HAD-IB family hydrolase [Spirochaetales bacterium]|jgi:HAD superfamily hydrolase (TIGR01490 family)|nr:HAD-IB family hydrolase [Spirochaetales bacterium]
MNIHLFDIDYTLVRSSTSYYFLREALSERLITLWQLRKLPFQWLLYKFALIDPNFIEKTVRLLGGISRSDIERLAQNAFDRKIRENLYAQGQDLIRQIRDRGERVVFATSSFDVLIRPLQEFLGVEEAITSVLEFKNGLTTGLVQGRPAFGVHKKEAVKDWLEEHGLDPGDAVFYSDSYSDLPVMDFCRRGVAVNPDSGLKKAALARNWEVVYFHN